MKSKKKKPKKVRKARNKEYKIIVGIINAALIRIFTRRTTKTFQQEQHFISKQIQEFVDASYIPKAIHTKEMLEQHFGAINLLETNIKKLRKPNSDMFDLDRAEGLVLAVKLLKELRK